MLSKQKNNETDSNCSSINKKEITFLTSLRDFGIAPIIGMLISMMTAPITTRMILPVEYGKVSMFTLFESFFLNFALLKLDDAYVRFYNQYKDKHFKLLSHCIVYPLLICVLILLISLFFGKQISVWLFGSSEILLMVGFCVFLPTLVVNRYCMLYFRMRLNGKVFSFLGLFSQILNFLILILLLTTWQRTFRSLIWASISSTIITTLIAFIFVGHIDFSNIELKFEKDINNALFKYALPLIPAGILYFLLSSFDRFGLRMWSSFEELGLYTAAFKIVSLLAIFQTIFSNAYSPLAYKWYEEKVPEYKFERMIKVALIGISVVFCGVVLFRDILFLFLGKEYRNTSKIFVFLLFIPLTTIVAYTTCCGINFSKKTIYNLYITMIAGLVNCIGNYLLIPLRGAEGAAISTCISYSLNFFLAVFVSRRVWFKFSVKEIIIIFALLLGLSISVYCSVPKFVEVVICGLVFIYDLIMVIPILKEYCNDHVFFSSNSTM